MKLLVSLLSVVALVNISVAVSASDEQGNSKQSLRLVSKRRLDENENRDLNDVDVKEFIWGREEVGQKRRQKRGFRGDDDSSSSGSKGSKSGSKGSKGGSSSKGTKSSKSSKSSSSSDDDPGQNKRRYRKDDDDCHGDDCCPGCGPICETFIYEFAGQAGSFIAEMAEDGSAIENEMFALYVINDQVYIPDGQLTNPLPFPVTATGKCLQVALGKFCSPTNQVCCEGVTMCDIQYSLTDEFGALGDIVVSGAITDNEVSVLPVVGGTGAFQKQAYGEVVFSPVYINDIELEGCPNISEIDYYEVSGKIYVEDCGDEQFVFAQQEAINEPDHLDTVLAAAKEETP